MHVGWLLAVTLVWVSSHRYPPDNRLQDGTQLGTSALESVNRWIISSIKVYIGWDLQPTKTLVPEYLSKELKHNLFND